MIREQFLRTIRKFRMIEKGETILVGVSGGADSAALLDLLCDMKREWKLNLVVVHVNHGLRGKAAQADAAFVRKLARGRGLAIRSAHVHAREKAASEKFSLEEAARHLRYEFFEKAAEAERAQKLALAHTLDDQAETVLMRVVMGTGLQGLQAIRPKRKFNGGYVIRPLIEIPRQEIRRYVKAHALKFREDRSNRSTQFLRNRIRLKLMPELERSYNPQVKRALARLPHLLDVDLAFLEETAGLFYKRLAKQMRADEIEFPKQSFLQLRPSIQYRLIGRAMRAIAAAELDFDHWNALVEKLHLEDRFKLQLPKGLIVSVSREVLRVHCLQVRRPEYSYSLSPGEEVVLPEVGQSLLCEMLDDKPRVVRKTDKRFELFDASKLSFPLTVRNRKPGDHFQPLGQANEIKLKGFLINKRVPVEERDRIPLVLSGETIVWVGGVAMADTAKITPKTKQFARISIGAKQL